MKDWRGSIELENGSAIGWQANEGGNWFGIGHTNGGLFFFRTASDPGTTGTVVSNPGQGSRAVLVITGEAMKGGRMKKAILLRAVFTALLALSGFLGSGGVRESRLNTLNAGVSARTIYVKCANGSGGEEDGSLARPYSTVAQGYSSAMPGDTLVIAGCRYPENITFSKLITIRNECGNVTIGAAGDTGPQDFVLTTSAVPLVNTGSLFDEWSDATTNSLGVAGEDPVGKRIYQYPAKEKWFPVPLPLGDVKQTLCGKLHDFFFYNPWHSGDEADWNLNIIPSPRYAYILEEAKNLPMVDLGEVKDCPPGERNCLQAEITPDESLYDGYNFYWFNANTETSPLEGKCLCTYGPWVLDKKHGFRPEIHPSELLWWKDPARAECGEPSSASAGTYLLLVQDDSNRYDRINDYDTMGTPDLCWRPWSAYPRTGKFKLAFRVNTLVTTPQSLRISILEHRNVNANLDDATDGSEHTLVYNGRPLLTVRELSGDSYVQVGFEGYFSRMEAEGEVLYGFVTLTGSVGKGDRGAEGYLLIRVTQ